MIERRKRRRSVYDPTYVAFFDRRQPPGVVATWCRVTGGEWCRARLHLTHLAAVLVARRGPTPNELPEDR